MTKGPNTPIRRGIQKCYTLDYDAIELLGYLIPDTKSHGACISELIRAEASRREARAKAIADHYATMAAAP